MLSPAIPAAQLPALTEMAEQLLGVGTQVAPEPYRAAARLAIVTQVNYQHFQGTLGRVLTSQGKVGATFRSTPRGSPIVVDPVAKHLWDQLPAPYRNDPWAPERITSGR